MNNSKLEQEDPLKASMDKDLVDLKGSMINSDNLKEAKDKIPSEMYLKNSKSSSVEAREAQAEKVLNKQ